MKYIAKVDYVEQAEGKQLKKAVLTRSKRIWKRFREEIAK